MGEVEMRHNPHKSLCRNRVHSKDLQRRRQRDASREQDKFLRRQDAELIVEVCERMLKRRPLNAPTQRAYERAKGILNESKD